MYIYHCDVITRFYKEEVIEWLVCNGDIDEEFADTYEPTSDDLKCYAWYCIENEHCEYSDITRSK